MRPIVVSGMHRSGTSFLIRALNLCGLWIGPEESLYTVEGRAGIGNPKGNYEHLEAVQINDDILAQSAGSWNHPPRELSVPESLVERMQVFLRTLHAEMPPGSTAYGFKDPRTVLTYQAWRQVVPRGMWITTFRHPQLVAKSLKARDGMDLESGYSLWAAYNSRLLRDLRDTPSLLIRFDVDKPALVAQVAHVCSHIGLQASVQRIASWYDAALVRNHLVDVDNTPLFQEVAPIWQELLAWHSAQLASVAGS